MLCAALAVCFAIAGCTSTVRPPAAVHDPVTVLLSFDSRHRGIVLPRRDRRWVEYHYGEMGWYAHMQDAWYDVFDTVLWPTQGALGRREIGGADVAAVRRRFSWIRFEPLEVERERVLALRDALDARFEAGRDEVVRNDDYGLDFVPVEDGFWCLFNCNDAVAVWLEDLGCDVSWVPIRTDLEVDR